MSKIATFAQEDYSGASQECRDLLLSCRARLEKMAKSPQKDGADIEVLVKVFGRIDRALGAL